MKVGELQLKYDVDDAIPILLEKLSIIMETIKVGLNCTLSDFICKGCCS